MLVGGLSLKDERREEEADGRWEVGFVRSCFEEVEGRVDLGRRGSRAEEEAEGTWEVGAVEARVVEGRCDVDVVGREDVCVVVEL